MLLLTSSLPSLDDLSVCDRPSPTPALQALGVMAAGVGSILPTEGADGKGPVIGLAESSEDHHRRAAPRRAVACSLALSTPIRLASHHLLAWRTMPPSFLLSMNAPQSCIPSYATLRFWLGRASMTNVCTHAARRGAALPLPTFLLACLPACLPVVWCGVVRSVPRAATRSLAVGHRTVSVQADSKANQHALRRLCRGVLQPAKAKAQQVQVQPCPALPCQAGPGEAAREA
ncbi:uncharacterized protein PSFLO_01181 [Pseudozyma flocculosa]|uniref:Uncharacterized protein n=1 Tax=Pseudozyma flocculosa TaxID=84751 RepID=A0A5C3EV40_9BASI|nr:uncharacterized protein PSFLO_01181 [Pseudozyma flocculosa]